MVLVVLVSILMMSVPTIMTINDDTDHDADDDTDDGVDDGPN